MHPGLAEEFEKLALISASPVPVLLGGESGVGKEVVAAALHWHVQVEGLTVDRADVRGRSQRPHGFGVEALQGAFTLWNQQADRAVVITAELLDISVGSPEAPVRGSGVFVGGHGDWNGKADGGTPRVSTLRTGRVVTDGRIPAGTPDLITVQAAVGESVTLKCTTCRR